MSDYMESLSEGKVNRVGDVFAESGNVRTG